MNTTLLNKIAQQINSTDKNLVISVAIKSLIELGMPKVQAIETILGAGAMKKIAEQFHDAVNN